MGNSVPKTTFWAKINGGLGYGSVQNLGHPLFISATIGASNFKFGMQLGFVV